MFQQQVYVINTWLMALDMACVIAAGYLADYWAFELTDGLWHARSLPLLLSVILVMFLNNYLLGRLGLYMDRRIAIRGGLFRQILKALVGSFLVVTASFEMMGQIDHARTFLALFAAAAFALLSAERLLFHLYINFFCHHRLHAGRLLVVGSRERANAVVEALDAQLSWGHEVVGFLSTTDQGRGQEGCIGGSEDLHAILVEREIDGVIFALERDAQLDIGAQVDICRELGIPARILPALWKPGDRSVSVECCQGVPFLTVQFNNLHTVGLFYKRLLDFAGGLAGTALFFFLYPFVALAIKLDSPGPVIFKQKRVGRNGRVFHVLKFRTMYRDAEAKKKALMAQNEMSGAMFKLANDPRVTRVGRFLRKTSLDEFPQFLNVLRGEMSLVGTRPPTVDEVETYEPWQRRRISERPGLTGLWQVAGRNEITDFNKVVELDCRYLENWHFLEDLRILLKTFSVVLSRKGAV
jgi:exopolysaccharide biosynthesis polyprenyl glycosylphosphotransferase